MGISIWMRSNQYEPGKSIRHDIQGVIFHFQVMKFDPQTTQFHALPERSNNAGDILCKAFHL